MPALPGAARELTPVDASCATPRRGPRRPGEIPGEGGRGPEERLQDARVRGRYRRQAKEREQRDDECGEEDSEESVRGTEHGVCRGDEDAGRCNQSPEVRVAEVRR